MMNEDVHVIRLGDHRGHLLRIGADGKAEIRGPRPEQEWHPAPLRALARAYAVGEGPWPWLRVHGIRRPSTTSGKSGAPKTRAEAVYVRLSPEERAALDALAARWGCSLSEAVARAVREAGVAHDGRCRRPPAARARRDR